MKLKFTKNKDGEISVKIGEKDFSIEDYIEMIKELKDENSIEAEFGGNISVEEQNSVKSMLQEINNIKETNTNGNEGEVDDEINTDDIPF